jgi:SAM-dependent methyltransferase
MPDAGNALAAQEPDFYRLWRAAQSPGDPQLDRWVAYEASQIASNRQLVAQLAEHHDFRGERVLDLGCQWGATTIALAQAGARVTGVDVVEAFASGARYRSGWQAVEASFAAGAAESLPFGPGTFDAVVAFNMIEHVDSHARCIAELSRVLRPGGVVYLDGPNRLSPRWLRSDPHYQMLGISVLPPALGRWYVTRLRGRPEYLVGTFPTAGSVCRLLRRHGIEVLYVTHRSEEFGHLAPPPPVAADGVLHALRLNLSGMFFVSGRKRG